MKNFNPKKGILYFLFIVSFFTFIIFWQVFFKNQIPFNANLLVSFYNPWTQEKFVGWEHGIPNKPTAKDDLWIFYPQRTFTTSILKNLEIPFWNPYSFSGNYHLGLSETAIFYPLNFLFLLLPQINVWVLLTIIQPIIVGVGMYLFLKRMVLNEKSAIFGALAFAFSGIVIVRAVEGLSVGHTLIWMPYVFWGIESFFQTNKTRFLLVILLALFFSLLAGWFQFTFYIIALALCYAIFKLFIYKKYSRNNFLVIIPFIVLPLITLFHTIPAFQALLESPRSAFEGRVFSHQHLMPLSHIFTLIIPDFWGNPATYNYFGKSDYKDSIMFIGIIPLVFFIISIFKRKSKEELFFIGAIIISLILSIDNPLSRLIISLPLPVFSSFLPNRIFLIITFSFAVLAAYGLDYLLAKEETTILKDVRKTFIILFSITVILFLFIIFPVVKEPTILEKVDKTGINIDTEAIRFRNSIIPFVFFLVTATTFFLFRNRYSKNTFFLIVIIILFLQTYIFTQKYIPFSYRQFTYPTHPVFEYLKDHQGLDRFMSIGFGHIVPSIPLQFGLYSPEGIGSMYIRRYGEFVRYMIHGSYGVPDKIAFDLEIYPKDVFLPKNNRLNRFFELTSVKYVVVDKKSMNESKIIPEKNHFNQVWENDKWLIYEYENSMPRFFTTSKFEIISDKEKILKSLFSDSFDPSKIILEENPGFEPKNYQGNLKINNYSPNKISMEVFTNNPTLIYLSDNYSKEFKVFIDNKQGKILRGNYTFRAIPVPEGRHNVRLEYSSESFRIGVIISIISFIFLTGVFVANKKYV